MIKVKAASGAVTFWEVHPDHPGGEVFVAGNREVEVAETPTVHRRVASGDLIVVEQSDGLDDGAPEAPTDETGETPADDAAETAGKRKRK